MTAPLIAIFGPTAVGKTAVAVATAQRLAALGVPSEAIGADALQVYRELPILTAQPTPQERAALTHHLVGTVPVQQGWSVAEHAPLAHDLIDRLRGDGVVPIVVGGTGLYLRAVLSELALAPPPDPGIREALLMRADEPGGLVALHRELAGLDAASAALIAPTDRTRVVRAHELLAAGRSFAAEQRSALWTQQPRVPTILVGLTMERQALRDRAARRVLQMLEAGVVEEVRAAAALGPSATARAAIGFEEFLAGDADAATVRTRQLAKRQETWMRRLEGLSLLDVTARTAEEVAASVVDAWRTAVR